MQREEPRTVWLSLLPLAIISLFIAVFASPGLIYSVALLVIDVVLAGWVYLRLRRNNPDH